MVAQKNECVQRFRWVGSIAHGFTECLRTRVAEIVVSDFLRVVRSLEKRRA